MVIMIGRLDIPDLIVAERGVGVVHHNDELNLGVGYVAEDFLMF